MRRVPFLLLAAACALLGSGCASPSGDGDVAAKTKKDKDGKEEPPGINLPFLLSMDFDEAKAISAKSAFVPPFVKVAADEIEVLKTHENGMAKKIRAKGHVFVQMGYGSSLRALGQEAIVSSEDIILRGSPVLQRGNSTVEGLSDATVFYVYRTQLRVMGPHRIDNGTSFMPRAPTVKAWQSGPNPLLPPLEASAVPDAVRGELERAAEAEAALQKSRAGLPPAFPEVPAGGVLPPPPSELIECAPEAKP